MEKSGRYHFEPKRTAPMTWPDSKNQSYYSGDPVMDTYEGQLDSSNECYDLDYENEDND